ncbi:MAG: hypothetical protein RLZZ393_1803 [Pseudomonadota bacterium]|jgi:hypothetical protein
MSDEARSHLFHAFRKVLRPLVKILIRAGVRHDEFAEVIKGVYVESAIRDGIGRDGPLTRARVSLTTGVPRRDVDRYIDNDSLLKPPPPTHTTTLTEVLHLWHTDPVYLGPYGIPLEIDFDSTPGRNFVELVARVDPKVDPIVVMGDLTRGGVVLRSGERYFKVVSRTFVMPEPMSPAMLEHLGNTLAHLANTIQHNMDRGLGAPKRLERSVFADNGLEPEALEEFDKYARARVQQLISEVDDWLTKRAPADQTRTDLVATGISMFHYIDAATQHKPLNELIR